jgi:hypothetical protein
MRHCQSEEVRVGWGKDLMRRIMLSILVVAVTGISALWLFGSQETRLILLVPLSLVLANHHPPEIAAGVISDADWRDQTGASRKFTALLQQRFPAGTDESTLMLQLLRQGFKPLSESYLNKAECQKPIQIEPLGTVSETCTYTYPQRILRYSWGPGIICWTSLSVMWSTDEASKIVRIAGSYYGACL